MLTKDEINWGDWGIFSFDRFMREFSQSEEFMHMQIDGRCYDHRQAVLDFIDDRVGPGDSVCFSLFSAINSFAKARIPHRVEDITGNASLYNPFRDNRAGAKPSIPDKAPDIFKFILEGDEKKGHALLVAFDQENEMCIDDVFADAIPVRKVGSAEAHATMVINKFPAYVRLLDDNLAKLLDKIGFTSGSKMVDGMLANLVTIPYGINAVSFPFPYYESLSDIPIFDLFATLMATQQGLKRIINKMEIRSYDLFFNLEPLAGGTIPRLHVQTYIRTSKNGLESHNNHPESRISMKDFATSHVMYLGPGNRSWQAYVPAVKAGKYDVRIEHRHERSKAFDLLSGEELWDLAEQLVYHSRALDSSVGIPARNIEIFPTGVIIRPFAVHGGHEEGTNERIYGQTPQLFAKSYNMNGQALPLALYKKPEDVRGKESFDKVMDRESPIALKAA